MKRRFSFFKPNVSQRSHSDNSASANLPDLQTAGLDNARNVLQLVSNLGSGAFSIPGLQAVGLIGVQIIDIIKVRRIYLLVALF
jgi:hypothetical protein